MKRKPILNDISSLGDNILKSINKNHLKFKHCFIAFIGIILVLSAVDQRGLHAEPVNKTDVPVGNPIKSENFNWSSGGPYGGYMYNLATAASDTNVLYAGTEDGVYASFNAGGSWGPTGLSGERVNSVAVNPKDAHIVYAGTDEGIKKSVNGGSTWISIGPFDNSTSEAHCILDIAISDQNPSIIYAVTWFGPDQNNYNTSFYVYKSIDGGNSWQTKFTKKEGYRILSILIDTDEPNRLYIGVEEWEIGLYISNDGGESWTGKRLPAAYTSVQEVVSLAMTSPGSKPARIWVIDRNYGVFASLDRGVTWTNAGVPSINGNGPWALAVDPVAPDTVYVGTRRWNADKKYYDGVLHKTTSAGGTWTTKTLSGLATGLVFSSDQQLYASFDNGVQRSVDKGDTWQKCDHGITLAPIAGLSVDPFSGKVYAVINEQTDDYQFRFNSYPVAVSSDQGSSWNYIDKGPKNLSVVALASGSPPTIWTGDGYKTSSIFYVHKSSDGGNSWKWIDFLHIYPGEVKYGAADILIDARNPQCVLFGFQHVIGDGILARTTDGGNTWTKLGESTSALAVDPNNADLVYRGRSSMGGVWAITNPFGDWQSVMIASYTDIGNVTDIEVDSDSKVYVAASDGLWRWDKSNWMKLTSLPNRVPTALAIDRKSTGDILFVGTSENGVYSSNDGGLTFESLNKGLGDLRIRKLAIDTGKNKRLYAGTAGGVWSTNFENDSVRRINPSILMLLLD